MEPTLNLIREEEVEGEGEGEGGGAGEEEGGVVSEEAVVGVASEVGEVEEEEPVPGEYRTSLLLSSLGYNYSFVFFPQKVTHRSQLTLHVFPVYPLTPFTLNNTTLDCLELYSPHCSKQNCNFSTSRVFFSHLL